MSLYNVLIKFLGVDAVSPKVKKITASMENLQKKISKNSSSIRDFSRSMLKISAAMGAVGIYALKNADDFEIMENQLKATTGSAILAKKIMDDMQALSMRAPFSPEDLVDASKGLLALGVPAEQLNEKMRVFGELAAGSGKSINEIAGFYTLVKNRGFMIARGMASINKAGIPLKETLKAMNKEHGISAKTFDALYSKTKFTLVEIDEAMTRIANNQFKGAMGKQAATLAGFMTIMHNQARKYAADLGDSLAKVWGIKDGLGGIVEAGAKLEPVFSKFLESHPKWVKMLTVITGITGAIAIMGYGLFYASFALKGLITTFGALSKLGLILLANPFIFMTLAAYALIEAISKLSEMTFLLDLNYWKQVGKELGGLFDPARRKSWSDFFPANQVQATNNNVATTKPVTQNPMQGILDIYMHDRSESVRGMGGRGDFNYSFPTGKSTVGTGMP